MTSSMKSTKIPSVLFCTVLLPDVFLQLADTVTLLSTGTALMTDSLMDCQNMLLQTSSLSCFVRTLCAGISPSFMYRGQVLVEGTFVREVFITEVTLVGDITMLDSFMVLGTAD